MKVVNIYGSPSSGKTVLAMRVTSILKSKGLNCEYVSEFAKDLVWDQNLRALTNQAYLFGNQYYRLTRIENAVDVAIVDSPLLLNIIYNHDPRLGAHFNEMVANVYSKFDNIDVLLPPPPIDKKYSTVGRVHSLEASQNLHARIKTMLNYHKIHYQEVSRDDLSWIDNIISNLEEDK